MTKKVILLLLPLLTLSLALLSTEASTVASAPPLDRADSIAGPTVLIRLNPQARQRYIAPPDVFLRQSTSPDPAAAANIVVNYLGSGWTAEARTAFEYAVTIWETLITSPVPIVVDAQFNPMGPGILGGTGPTDLWRDFPNAPQSNTWYSVATANKLANTDLNPSAADIQATFNSAYSDWHFGTGSSTPLNKINFSTVVLHELGHGLGFSGSMRVDNGSGYIECTGVPGIGCYGYSSFPTIYDRYTKNGAGTPLLAFPNFSTALAGQLTNNSLFFDSPGAKFANGGNPVPLYAPSTWLQGSSYSHLAESYNNTPDALMTFSVSKGETIYNPGSVTLCMFKDMGWTIDESCSAAGIIGLTAANNGPTVLGSATQLSAAVSGGSNISYEWDFGDGSSGAGSTVSHKYAAPGTYTAVVTATNSASQEMPTTTVNVDSLITNLTAANDGPTLPGFPTQLTATVSGGSDISYEWDFGDGSSGTGSAISHKYAAPGRYTAKVTATNSVSQETAATNVRINETTDKIYYPVIIKP